MPIYNYKPAFLDSPLTGDNRYNAFDLHTIRMAGDRGHWVQFYHSSGRGACVVVGICDIQKLDASGVSYRFTCSDAAGNEYIGLVSDGETSFALK